MVIEERGTDTANVWTRWIVIDFGDGRDVARELMIVSTCTVSWSDYWEADGNEP